MVLFVCVWIQSNFDDSNLQGKEKFVRISASFKLSREISTAKYVKRNEKYRVSQKIVLNFEA